MSIVKIITVEDLYRFLTLKRVISRRAHEELLTIAGDQVLKNQNPNDEEIASLMEDEKTLLSKFANHPTLSEWNKMPHMQAGNRWGSTFGLTILIGELILIPVNETHRGFPVGILSRMLYGILGELENPTSETLIEPFESMVNFNIERADHKDLTDKEKKDFIRRVLTGILQSFVTVMEKYGLIEATSPMDAMMLPLGKRVLMHMQDAQEFIKDLEEAHTRLQSERPNLSTTTN